MSFFLLGSSVKSFDSTFHYKYMRPKIREENKEGLHARIILLGNLLDEPASNRFITLFLYHSSLTTEGVDAMTWRL
jgi:hypothetical protein